jgi:hypothetical protein
MGCVLQLMIGQVSQSICPQDLGVFSANVLLHTAGRDCAIRVGDDDQERERAGAESVCCLKRSVETLLLCG